MPKLIVLYEDVINEAGETSKHPRYKLIRKKVFSEVNKGSTSNFKFLEPVRDYIECTYDTEYLDEFILLATGLPGLR